MTRLKISPDLALPLSTVTNTQLILARKRVGKTYTAHVMAEEMVKHGLPWVAIDPTGAWWGLTSSKDGRSEGLPVVVIGGPHGHIPLEPLAGKVIANLVVDHPGWYVIDLSRLDHRHEEIRFAGDFGHQLYRRKQRNPTAMHLWLDEADMFVPQKLPKNATGMFSAYDAIVRRGGVYGIGVTLISQRPALVNKDVTTQCETLIALQTSAPEDQDPILDWVSRNGSKEQVREMRQSLASLRVGEAWFFSPDTGIFKKIHIRERETFNSSATPKPGAKPIEPKVFAQVDLDELGEEVRATVERTRQEDPMYLRSRIADLERQVKVVSAQPVLTIKPPVEVEVAVPVLTDEQMIVIRGFGEQFRDVASQALTITGEMMKALNLVSDGLKRRKTSFPPQVRQSTPAPPSRQVSSDGTTLHPKQQAILDVLAWMRSVGLHAPKRYIVAFLSGQSPKSSAFDGHLRSLRDNGCLYYAEDDRLTLLDLGIQFAHTPFVPLTTSDLHNAVLSKLPAKQRAVLSVLLSAFPNAVERSVLAEQTNQSRTSSAFDGHCRALRDFGIVEFTVGEAGQPALRALPVMFIEERS